MEGAGGTLDAGLRRGADRQGSRQGAQGAGARRRQTLLRTRHHNHSQPRRRAIPERSKMNALAKQDFSREQIDLIKQTVARGATDNELKLFLYAAHRTGLDPLTKQIYFIKRRVWNVEKNGYDLVGTIQTGIDGYRVVAARNGLAGIDDVIFDSEDKQHPNKATVSVYRMVGDTRVSFTASARWSEYVQVNNKNVPIAMWKKMPYLMLGKVAEALALRKAFPADLSGVYTSEEMDQAEEEAPQSRQIEPPNKTAEALVDIASKEPEYTRPEQLADEIA